MSWLLEWGSGRKYVYMYCMHNTRTCLVDNKEVRLIIDCWHAANPVFVSEHSDMGFPSNSHTDITNYIAQQNDISPTAVRCSL